MSPDGSLRFKKFNIITMIAYLRNILSAASLTLSLCTALVCSSLSSYAQSGEGTKGALFPQRPGVVSYTYRKYFEKDVPSTLDIIKGNGITDIEFSNLFGKTAAELRKMTDAKGIYCSSFGVGYDDLVNKTAEVAQNAITLGAKYVRVAGIPHKSAFTLEEAQKAVDDFNRLGKILKE
jgi:hypothetical protein